MNVDEKINGLTLETYLQRSIEAYIFKKLNGLEDEATKKWDKHLASLKDK